MGKEMTPKALANKMKAKGLQKLRWYCEMCQKQCRDENGFKCHCMSEGHQRQMAIFAQNPHKVMDQYTKEFEKGFLDLLSRRFGARRVSANIVYNEYIADKTHTHMNSTIFDTLTNFVKYLGRTSKCVIDETEKGWYIQYIDRDPAVLARQEALERSKKKDLDDQQRHEKLLDKLVKQAKAAGGGGGEEFTGLERDEEGEEVKFALGPIGKKKTQAAAPALTPAAVFGDDDDDEIARLLAAAPVKQFKAPAFMAGMSDAILAGGGPTGPHSSRWDEGAKAKSEPPALPPPPPAAAASSAGAGVAGADGWLAKGIVVQIKNNRVGGGAYLDKKGVVIKLESRFVGLVRILGTKEALRIDQNDLETVIPQLGRPVMIVAGPDRGKKGSLYSVSPEEYTVAVQLTGEEGRIVPGLEYEHICKLDEEYEAKHAGGEDKKRKRTEE